MRLHFIIQSHFYTQRIIDKIRQIEPQGHEFIIVYAYNDLKWVKSGSEKKYSFKEAISKLKDVSYDCVYIHFLSTSIAHLILKSNLDQNKLAWVMWGADYYRIPEVRDAYFMEESKKFAPKIKPVLQSFKRALNLPNYDLVTKVMKACKYYIWYKEEYDVVSKTINSQLEYVDFEYYFSMSNLPALGKSENSHRILVGNSDDPTNNHIDVIRSIGAHVPKECELVIPLSGASSRYLKAIRSELKKFNLTAQLILEQKTVDEFFQILSDVEYVIFGHLRQQGCGTLFPLLYAGKKVFMWKENPLFKTLQRWGIIVDHLDELSIDRFSTLMEEDKNLNRKVLDNVLSEENNRSRWKKALNI